MIDAILDHPCTGHATVEEIRKQGGIREMNISHVAYPALNFDTPSGKIEFYSERAAQLGLSALPAFDDPAQQARHEKCAYPLALAQGRTMTQFHSFYNSGRELPTLAKREAGPTLWISPEDAAARQLADRGVIRIFNERGEMTARAHVTDRIPAGTVWMHDGWLGLNTLSSGNPLLPDAAVDIFGFSAGQARFGTMVQVVAA